MKLSFRHILPVLAVAVLPAGLAAQTDLELKFETAGVTGGGDHAPFWHTSNRQGLPSISNSNGYTHFAALGSTVLPYGFDMGYGADFGAGAGLENNLFLHQLYFDLNYKWLGVSAGMKERWSDKNHTLSTGGLTWSGNSQPIPEARAGIPEFVSIPFLGNWVSLKGHVGFGRLTDDKWRSEHSGNVYMDGLLFHSKSAFLRFGDAERFPLEVSIGLEMNNVFGGVRHNLAANTATRYPSDLEAYWTALFPFHEVEHKDEHLWASVFFCILEGLLHSASQRRIS